ncbi:MAG TPA: flagellar motor switch protein FliG [Beijerinckiaceae bacterium]|nr:flagellar motor switch protein FliG [Beijerinckiaceae bacterium]
MRPATGAERAALVLIALGEKHGAQLWQHLDDGDIEAVSTAMVRLGRVDETYVNAAIDLFAGSLQAGAVTGNVGSAEKLLRGVLPEDRVAPILERIRRPDGPNVWERLSALNAQVLADYLSGEHPQTVAVVLARLPAERSATVIERLEPAFALQCLERMARPSTVDGQTLVAVEQALGAGLAEVTAGSAQSDPAASIADIFNALDRRAGDDLLGRWTAADADTAARIRSKMFTFDDFAKLDAAAAQALLRVVDRELLAVALKGAGEPLRAFFMNQMSSRAARMFEDQMSARGPMRRSEVEQARIRIVGLAKELIASGEIRLPTDDAAEDVIE